MALFGNSLVAGDQPRLAHPGDIFNRNMPPLLDMGTQQAVNGYAAIPAILQNAAPQIKTWQKVVGAIGDALQTAGGGHATFMPAFLDQQDKLQARTDAEREMQAKFAQALALKQMELNKPVNNDTVNDYNFWKSVLPEDQFKAYVQNKVNPPQYRQGPDGNFYPINTAQGAAPAKPVGKLTPITGGGTGNGVGGFR